MAWVTFTQRFIFVPPEDRRCSVVYPAGYRGNVRRVCEQMARAAGALEEPDVSGTSEAAADVPISGA